MSVGLLNAYLKAEAILTDSGARTALLSTCCAAGITCLSRLSRFEFSLFVP